ncbi:MAG: flagellar hook-basal body complex protein FliE [Halarcobacter sp.]
MNISAINNSLSPIINKENQTKKTDDSSFEEILKGAITDVNKTQVEGYKAMEGIATGEVKNLQEAVQKIEEAELSLKLALEVKNKALGAYKEIMRMSV